MGRKGPFDRNLTSKKLTLFVTFRDTTNLINAFLQFNLVVMSQESTLREVCEIVKKYRMGDMADPEVQEWYQRIKAKDDQTIFNLREYIKRKNIKPNPES
jgi:hypothetical protein